MHCCKIVFNITHCSGRHQKAWKWHKVSAVHFLVLFSFHSILNIAISLLKKLYGMIVIGGDAGRQKTVFFSLTLLTLQAQNSRRVVLIGKWSKSDTGERTENCIQLAFLVDMHIHTH